MDYSTAEGTVDGTHGGPMYEQELDRRHEASVIQKGYKTHRKETDDILPRQLPRETLAERRRRIESVVKKPIL